MPGNDVFVWVARAGAAIEQWDPSRASACRTAAIQAASGTGYAGLGLRSLKLLLHQARAALRLQIGQLSIVVSQSQVFDYFDEVRKVIETATSEVFFVDAYLDAEFVSRYLPHAAKGVSVRLLGGPQRMATLLSAVDVFAKQHGTAVEVRSSDKLHDRFLFVDGEGC